MSTEQTSSSQQSSDSSGDGPVGEGNHLVRQGDCVESIAYEKGFFWQTIWNDSQNAELKRIRKSPNDLLAGDKLYVPERRLKEESCATEETHRFRRKGVPSKLHIVLKDGDEPRASVPYILEIDGELFSGKTDDDGAIKHPIPPNAERGELTLGEKGEEKYPLHLGCINPNSEISGVQGRLRNLGFYLGQADGTLNPETVDALKDFQAEYGLEVTGKPDEPTRNKLVEQHGC